MLACFEVAISGRKLLRANLIFTQSEIVACLGMTQDTMARPLWNSH